jgi:hypothetical protein
MKNATVLQGFMNWTRVSHHSIVIEYGGSLPNPEKCLKSDGIGSCCRFFPCANFAGVRLFSMPMPVFDIGNNALTCWVIWGGIWGILPISLGGSMQNAHQFGNNGRKSPQR